MRKVLRMGDTELALVLPATAAAADKQAFIQIWHEYYPTVYGIALRSVGTKEEAEDVAQEAFFKLYQVWPHLHIKTSIKAWLARVTINNAYNRHRGRRRARLLYERVSDVPRIVDSAEDEVIAAYEIALVSQALRRMRARDRACLILRHSGLSYQEVADATGVRPVSVGKVLQRAESKLRELYDEVEGRGRA